MKTVAAAVLVLAALGVSACSSGSAGAGAAGLPGGISGTCAPVWTFNTTTGNPVFRSYAAAYQAAESYIADDTAYGTAEAADDLPVEVTAFTVRAGQAADVGGVTVAYYGAGGAEIGSYEFPVNETLTPGQSLTEDETEYPLTQIMPGGKPASCKVATWTAPTAPA